MSLPVAFKSMLDRNKFVRRRSSIQSQLGAHNSTPLQSMSDQRPQDERRASYSFRDQRKPAWQGPAGFHSPAEMSPIGSPLATTGFVDRTPKISSSQINTSSSNGMANLLIDTMKKSLIDAGREMEDLGMNDSKKSLRGTSFWASDTGWVINHSSSQIMVWTLVILFCTIITAVVVPIEVAFFETKLNGLFVFNRAMDIFFLIDIVCNFFLSFQDGETGMVVRDKDRIVSSYLSFWFWMDVVSTVPYDLIAWALAHGATGSSGSTLKNVKLLRIIRLFRLMKLLRIFRAGRLFQTYQMDFAVNYNTFALVKFLTTIIFIVHMMSCGLVFLEELTEDGYTWQDENGVRGQSTGYRYIWAMYWSTMTVSTIGYGDVSLVTQAERLYASLCMIIGAMSYAFIVGQLCTLIVNLDKEGVQFRDDLSDLNRFMANEKLPHRLQIQVRHFFGRTKETREGQEQRKLLDALSPGLKGLVLIHITARWLKRVPFLAGHLTGPFVTMLAKAVQTRCYAPKERMVEMHQKITRMYILHHGLVIYDGHMLMRYQFFGEEIICRASMRFKDDAVAFQYTTVREMRRADLQHVLTQPQFAHIRKQLRKHAVKLRFQTVGAQVIRKLASSRNLNAAAALTAAAAATEEGKTHGRQSATLQLLKQLDEKKRAKRGPQKFMDQIFKIGQKGMDESTDTMGDLYQELSLDQVDLKYLQEDDSSRPAPDGVLTGAGTRVPARPASPSSPRSSASATPVQQYVRRAGGGGGGGRRGGANRRAAAAAELAAAAARGSRRSLLGHLEPDAAQFFGSAAVAAEDFSALEEAHVTADEIGQANTIEDLSIKIDALRDELSGEFNAKLRLLEQTFHTSLQMAVRQVVAEMAAKAHAKNEEAAPGKRASPRGSPRGGKDSEARKGML